MIFKTINPNKILLSNQGYMKINDIEVAELKNLEIKLIPEMREIVILNSVSKGKMITSINGSITFELNKIYGRFKPTMLECARYGQLFYFILDATVKAPKKPNHKNREEETIFIGNCWLEGDMPLFALKSETDFLTEKYQAGFEIESASYEEIIDDNYAQEHGDWESNGFSYI
ncbi:hypothetical protein CLPUN_05050 [Clostridium puniceum]|uniref:Uncharacterized protein n=1 Tax=Clostridium puniceum TaxID=29367 RepID=A0A1S8TWL0_9CLOT|nr:phage tail tube protein [Clostridium puniceum]OOM82126.1 hypothetical protein CLPUN_05050 [Clostridium puniceum]